MDWRIREIYAGSKPRLFPMARVVDVDTQIFYILFQLDRFIKDGKADCFIFPLMRYKEGLSFIGVNTESFFMAPLLDFSSLILERAYWAVSNHVLICVPSIVMTVPPAYPRHQIWWSVSRFIKELATRFHNKGDKIPPRGQPLDTIHVNVCPWYWDNVVITTSGRVCSNARWMSIKTHKELFGLSSVRFSFAQSWLRAESVEFVRSISLLSGVKWDFWDNFAFYF